MSEFTNFEDCVAPAAEALAVATTRYHETDLATAPPVDVLSVLSGLREAELAYDSAVADCKRAVAQHVLDLITTGFGLDDAGDLQCMLDGAVVSCAEAAETLQQGITAFGGML